MKRIAVAELALALAAALGATEPRAADREAAPPPAPRQDELVEAGALWAHPGRYLGRELVLRVEFRDWIERWDPFVTRFGAGQYRAFAAWGDEQFPWVQADFDAPRARLFVLRDSAADWALDVAQRYDAFELSVAVRAVFADVPWVEVLGVRPLVRRITEGSILHATRALELIDRHAWDLADAELERALTAPLPERARLEIERLRRACAEGREQVESIQLVRPPQRAEAPR